MLVYLEMLTMLIECIIRTWTGWWTTPLSNVWTWFQLFWTSSIVIGFERACEPKHQITMDHVQNHWKHIHKLHKCVVHQIIQVLLIHSINMVSTSQYRRNIQTIYQYPTYPTRSICTHLIRHYILQWMNNKYMQIEHLNLQKYKQ